MKTPPEKLAKLRQIAESQKQINDNPLDPNDPSYAPFICHPDVAIDLLDDIEEMQARCAKGELSVNPEIPPELQKSNVLWLREELKDLRGAIDRIEHWLDRDEY